MAFDHLFQPGRIGPLDVPNRFVQSPVQTRGGDADGFVTEELIDFHRARSRDGRGPGLVMAQQTFAWPAVKLQRGLALWDDKYVDGLARLADAVKAGGSRVVLQLGGSGSRLEGVDMAPSPVAGSWNVRTPRAITRDEMMRYLECYAQAGRRLYRAGFEGFSLHGGAGKYIAQFLSPWSNRREDEFGGSPAARVRYPLMIVDAIRALTRPDFPVIMRAPCCEHLEGGLCLEEGIEQIALMAAHGVDAFILSDGGQETLWYDCPSYIVPRMPGLADTAAVKAALPQVTIIANGGVHDPADAERIVAEGQADFVGLCRPLLADPDYVDKVRRNRPETIRVCLRCNNCQTWDQRPWLAERGMCCTVNPALMAEKQTAPVPTATPQHILVVGGGLAGMAAAATLAERGHEVDLHEKTGELGGQWLAASAAPDKDGFRTLIPALRSRLDRAGARVHLHSAPDVGAVRALRPDAVVLATGARPRPLEGVDILTGPQGERVDRVFALDVLRDRAPVGRRVVVLGGRYIGMECAVKLAREGRVVSLVERDDIGRGLIPRIRSVLFRQLAEQGVRLFPRSTLFRVTARQVEVAHGGSVFPLDADTLALAIGTVPDRSLREEDLGAPVHTIGDCDHIGDAREAVAQGTELGLRL